MASAISIAVGKKLNLLCQPGNKEKKGAVRIASVGKEERIEITPTPRVYNDQPPEVKTDSNIKEKVKERDNFKCQSCGKKVKSLEIHHKDGRFQNNNLDNLITLCRSCHNRAHLTDNVCVGTAWRDLPTVKHTDMW